MSGFFVQLARQFRLIRRNQRGVSAIEFALIFPLFLGFVLSGLEIANLVLVNLKIQRLASMSADFISQNGVNGARISEYQIYDILSAMDIGAQPLDIRAHGRIVLTAVFGEDKDENGTTEINRIKWQRFDGALVSAVPTIGCKGETERATLANDRRLSPSETLYQAQVTYEYQPLIAGAVLKMFTMPTTVTRTAAFRGRSTIFYPILSTDGYPPKDNCHA